MLLHCYRFNDKYSKDLVATKKKLGDAQLRISALEKQVVHPWTKLSLSICM